MSVARFLICMGLMLMAVGARLLWLSPDVAWITGTVFGAAFWDLLRPKPRARGSHD